MRDHDLVVTLTYASDEHESLHLGVEDQLSATRATTDQITDAAERTDRLAHALGIDTPTAQRPELRSVPAPAPVRTWDELVAEATRRLSDEERSLDDLIDDDQRRRIDRRFGDGFAVRTGLDRYDILAAVAAGVTGALLDYFVTAVPAGSDLTEALRSLSIDSDNWLSGIAKVPYDRVAFVDLEGFNPHTHRVQTFGHDPLLGWVYGTMDILRGSLTGVSRSGTVKTLQIGAPAAESLPAALGLQAMHLISDIATPAGLPLPGWTALLTIDRALPGADHTIGELSRWMYVKGYDTWHLPSLAAPLLGIEVVLRGYLALRELVDDDYRDDLDIDRARAGTDRVADIPRYAVMSLIAQGIAAAGNAGRFAISGANPLTLNYVLWLNFSRSLLSHLDGVTPASALTEQAARGRIALDVGWGRIPLDTSQLPVERP